MNSPEPLLSVRISVDYLNRPCLLDDVSFHLYPGEIFGLAGQSGSGKSTLALAILRLLALKGGSCRGTVRFSGQDLAALSESRMRRIRGREIALILQSPASSLNPALRILTHLREAWRTHGQGLSAREEGDLFLRMMENVNLPPELDFLRRYPSQISVGQAQRLLIAMAILHRPKLLIADEPTSALDPITQSEILQLFSRLNRQLNMSILYISHDLLSIASLCQRVAILDGGKLVECASARDIFQAPVHPYTRKLVAALPKLPGAPGVAIAGFATEMSSRWRDSLGALAGRDASPSGAPSSDNDAAGTGHHRRTSNFGEHPE